MGATMTPDAIAEAADILARNWIERMALTELPPTCRPLSEDDAYAVQDAMNERLLAAGHGAIAGYKIGCTTPVMQKYMGIDHPGAGAVLAPTVHDQTATLKFDDFVNIGVETEIAVRLASDLLPESAPFDLDSVMNAVGECMAAFELVDARYVDYRTLDVWTMVADDFFNAGCVLGRPLLDWRRVDLAAVTGVIIVNDKEAGRGTGGNVMGHPFESVVWLANSMARRGLALGAGQFILTGSIIETQWLAKGDRAAAEISELGTVSVEFV
jgi:2-keto-4-pentenoate hydratase